jgi:hypothetical protein
MATATLLDGQPAIPPAAPVAAEADVTVEDHPGRWIGGAIGAMVALATSVVLLVGTRMLGSGDAAWAWIGVLGVPVAFVLGRHLLPLARSERWRGAITVGLLVGWLAPPLGAIEIVYGLAAANAFDASSTPSILAFVLVPYAIAFSFVAVVITLPAGVVWAIVVRLVRDDTLLARRAPAWLEAFGARHVALLLAIVLVGLDVIGLAIR